MKKDEKQYRILIVEDNPGDLFIVEDFLSEKILVPEITHKKNFHTASENLAGGAMYDLILLDLSLPDKSGRDLITSMLEISQAPIIILTGYADIDFSIKSITLGIYDYLLKDGLSAEMLYKSIVYALERKKNISTLQESEKRYSDLFQLSPQPMFLLDLQIFKFIQVNKAAIDLYGYNETEFMELGIIDLSYTDDGDDEKRIPFVENNKGIIRHCKKSGEIIDIELYSTPVVINNKEMQLIVVIDVTEKNQFENKITRAIIKTQEDERYEIGGELHDNVCQILAASQMSLGLLSKSITAEKIHLLNQTNNLIRKALDEIRSLSHQLAPAFFDDLTLEDVFKNLFNTFNLYDEKEILLHFDHSLNTNQISMEIQLNLYRILQEQVRNIVKYANATRVEVRVLVVKDRLNMEITDNGVGFNPDGKVNGIGLANMKRRAELFSGKFGVHSSPGSGCTIAIEIPLAKTDLVYL